MTNLSNHHDETEGGFDPILIAAKMVLSELDAYERSASPIEHGASLERAIVNLQNAVDAHEAIENWMASSRGGRL